MSRSLMSFSPMSLTNRLANFPSWGFPYMNLGEELDENMQWLKQQSGLSVSEDNENVYVEADMPGVPQQNIQITVDKGILWIKGERHQETKDEAKKYYSKAESSYSYRVAIPGQVDESVDPCATYHEGILKVCFKKAKQNVAKCIPIKNSSSKNNK